MDDVTLTTPQPLRILVCGGRHWHDERVIEGVLDLWLSKAPDGLTLIHCGQAGVQSCAAAWALAQRAEGVALGIFALPRPRGEPAAAHAARVVAEGRPHVVFAFPGDEAAPIVQAAQTSRVKVRFFEWGTTLKRTTSLKKQEKPDGEAD